MIHSAFFITEGFLFCFFFPDMSYIWLFVKLGSQDTVQYFWQDKGFCLAKLKSFQQIRLVERSYLSKFCVPLHYFLSSSNHFPTVCSALVLSNTILAEKIYFLKYFNAIMQHQKKYFSAYLEIQLLSREELSSQLRG